ncbi:MAG: TadE/TadG family type IV pilus assembly protein [Anaerolineales bacterium]|nr:TadE/TadG family type IV pilus assembly protein [Anaerolineales bacterium]
MSKTKRVINGQGLVEFALALPILLLLRVGVLDFGMAFFVKVELENAAREGAYYMVYHTSDGKANSFALAKAAVQIEGQGAGIAIPLADIEVKCLVGTTVDNSCPSGSTVVVTVRHQMTLAVDIFFNGPLALSDDARMLIP